MFKSRKLAAVASCTALALGLAACGGDGGGEEGVEAAFGAAFKGIVNPSDKTGGTLRFGNTGDFDSADPGNTYEALTWNFMRTYTRPMMTFKPEPGTGGLTVIPDLAESLGEVSNGGKTVTYKIKKNIKYEDGTVVKAQDVKYAIERSNYAKDILPNGPNYFQTYLEDDTYVGPYKDPSPDKLGLKSIETPDDTTLIFHLKQPFADLDALMTNPQTAPVPQAKDTGAKYEFHPMSTGPYKFEKYEKGKLLTLVKNDQWDPDTDETRKQLVDRIEVTMNMNADDLDNRLLSGQLDIDIAGVGVQAATQAKLLGDPNLKKQADNVPSSFLRFYGINQNVKPFDNVHCRRAVHYAADKVALQTAYGGPVAGGDIAHTLLPPTIAGHEDFNSYPPGPDNHGDPVKAKEELAMCGQPNGFSTKIMTQSDRPRAVASAEALQQALVKVGIKTEIKGFPFEKYSTSYGGAPSFVHANGFGILIGAWAPDWPTGFGMLQQIVDGRAIKPAGSYNLGEENNPKVNALFDKAATTTDANERNKIYGQIDRLVMEDATTLPYLYAKALMYRNPRVTNIYVHQGYSSQYDYAVMGVSE